MVATFTLRFLAAAAPAVDMRVPAAATDVAAVFTNFRLVNSIVLCAQRGERFRYCLRRHWLLRCH